MWMKTFERITWLMLTCLRMAHSRGALGVCGGLESGRGRRVRHGDVNKSEKAGIKVVRNCGKLSSN